MFEYLIGHCANYTSGSASGPTIICTKAYYVYHYFISYSSFLIFMAFPVITVAHLKKWNKTNTLSFVFTGGVVIWFSSIFLPIASTNVFQTIFERTDLFSFFIINAQIIPLTILFLGWIYYIRSIQSASTPVSFFVLGLSLVINVLGALWSANTLSAG